MQEQMQQQSEAMQMQRESAMTALQEQQAKVRETNARADKLEAEAQALSIPQGDSQGADINSALMQVRQQASDEIERVSGALQKAQSELANRTVQIDREANTKLECARIDADAKERVAAIQATSDRAIEAVNKRLDTVMESVKARQEIQTKPKN